MAAFDVPLNITQAAVDADPTFNYEVHNMSNDKPAGDPTTTESILAERGTYYGDFVMQAVLTQRLLSILNNHGENRVLPDFMVEGRHQLIGKLARAHNGNPFKIDTWDDIAGYAKLVANGLREMKADGDERVID